MAFNQGAKVLCHYEGDLRNKQYPGTVSSVNADGQY